MNDDRHASLAGFSFFVMAILITVAIFIVAIVKGCAKEKPVEIDLTSEFPRSLMDKAPAAPRSKPEDAGSNPAVGIQLSRGGIYHVSRTIKTVWRMPEPVSCEGSFVYQ